MISLCGFILGLFGPDGIDRPDYDYIKELELHAYHVPKNELVVVDVQGVAIAGQAVVQGGVGPQVQNVESCVFDVLLIDQWPF